MRAVTARKVIGKKRLSLKNWRRLSLKFLTKRLACVREQE
jgi:hypothetical protein